jgi:Ca2+/Na+ antiporter
VLGLSDTVIGITISAIGTSFPNMWSSVVVARQGLGDVAIANAMGSNIFNICCAIGIPWLMYTAGELSGGTYNGLKDDAVTALLYILMIVLALFYIQIWLNNWIVENWFAYEYMFVYIVVISIAIALE